MVWFKAGSNVAKLAIKRFVCREGSIICVARSRIDVLSQGGKPGRFMGLCSSLKAPVPRPVPLSKLTDSFLDVTSSLYLEELQWMWEADLASFDESWDNFFRNFVGKA